jgi:uncharacterized protein
MRLIRSPEMSALRSKLLLGHSSHALLSLLILTTSFLASCGNSSFAPGTVVNDLAGGSDAQIYLLGGGRVSLLGAGQAAGTTGSKGWSSMGTRLLSSSAQSPILSNADGKWTDYNPATTYPKTVVSTANIPMADGIKISVKVTLPADANGAVAPLPLPTIVTLTGYDKDSVNNNDPTNLYFVSQGYAHVVFDVPGTGSSEGTWQAFDDKEQADYVPMLNWVVAQKFCNGNIGIYGASLLAISGELAAAKRHPAVKAVFLLVPMSDGYRDIVFNGGQTDIGFIPLWMTLVSADTALNADTSDPQAYIQRQLTHNQSAAMGFQGPLLMGAVTGDPNVVFDGSFWQQRSPIEQVRNIQVPTFVVGGLQDIFQRGEPLLYEAISRQANTKLLIGPWTHIGATKSGLPADGVPVFDHMTLQWFDQYLRGRSVGADKIPNVTQYVYGYGHYVTTTDWPHPQASALKMYLHGDRSISDKAPAAGEATNMTLQEPANGVCSASTSQWTAGAIGLAPTPTPPCMTDDSSTEALDVHYETSALDDDLYINGPIYAEVWAATTASDAGLAVRVDDVDGATATPLTTGLQTFSMSTMDLSKSRLLDGQIIQPWHSFTKEAKVTVTPNSPMKIGVEVFPTSALIKKGHKLRFSIGPSDFPHGLPPLTDLSNSAVGAITLYSDADHPSSVVMPSVPTSALPLP